MTATAAPQADDREQVRYARRVLSVTSLGVLLAGTNTSTLDVALPVVARHFNASATQASWIVLSYMLVNTVLILVFGRVADLVGRRRLYLFGLGTLTASSLLCGLAPSAELLSVFRALQAIGAAAIITNTTAMITDAAPPRILPQALGFNVSAAAAAQVAGPIVGGLFATELGWRWVFWFNVPVGVIGLVWARLSLRRDVPHTGHEPFDGVGAGLSFALVGGLVLALSEGGAVGWSSPLVIVGVVLTVVALPAFLISQRRRPYPMVDLHVFADRERSIAYVCVFLLAMARFAVVLLVALYLQAASGVDAFQTGLRVIPVALGISVISPIAGRLAGRYATRTVASAGMGLAVVGLVVLAVVISPTVSYPPVGLAMLAVGVGTGLFMTPNTTTIMGSVDAARRGVANGVRSMLQNTGFVVSTALSLAIATSPLGSDDKRAAYAGTLASLRRSALDEFTTGYRVAFSVLAAACLLGMVASLSRRRGSTGWPRAAEPRRSGRRAERAPARCPGRPPSPSAANDRRTAPIRRRTGRSAVPTASPGLVR